MRTIHGIRATAVLQAALLFASASASAQMPPVHTVEAAVESSVLNIHLPDVAPGTVILAGCPGCIVHDLALPADATYTINGRGSTLVSLRSMALAHSDATVTLHYLPGTRRVTRIDLTVF